MLDHEGWDEDRSERAGDRIESIWIATPDGKGQFVVPSTPSLFVPGVHAGDSVTYRYMGSRPLQEKHSPVTRGGLVQLDDPDRAYARGVQFGVAAWGGWRYLRGPEGVTEWNPGGGAEFILAIPAWRAGPWSWLYIEPELHVGAAITTHSYESIDAYAGPSAPLRRCLLRHGRQATAPGSGRSSPEVDARNAPARDAACTAPASAAIGVGGG